MNKISQQLNTANTQLSNLEKRIAELENNFYYFNKKIQDESNNNMELAKSQQNDINNNSYQIQSLNEKIDLIMKSTNDILNQFKSSMDKEITERASQLKTLIEEKSTRMETLDRRAQDNQYINKSFENNFHTKLSAIEKDILSSIKKLTEDFNTNSAKIEFLEKKQIEYNTFYKEQMSNINKKLINFQNEFIILNQFKDNSNENFAGMASDIMQ
jgi:predicted outer membrane protein